MAKRRGHGEGTISFVDDKKLWKARVTLETGKRTTKYFKSQKEAKDWVLRVRGAVRDGLLSETEKLTLGQFLERYIADYAQHAVRASTLQSYSNLIRLHIVPELGRIKLNNLRPDHLHTLYAMKREEGLSDRTIQYIHGMLHRSLNKALRWGMVSRNIANHADAPSNKRKPMKVWDQDQVRAFLDCVKEDRWAPLYILACGTGMREGEILALRWQDVDLRDGKLQVMQSLQSIRGRGVVISEPKSEKSRRQIVLPEIVLQALRAHKTRQDEMKKAERWQENGLVFTTNNGTAILPRNLVRHFKCKIAQAGVQEIRFHDMRHTVASLLLAGDVHPKVVQELLGHAQISLTLDTYSHVLPTMQREAAKRMDGFLKVDQK